jgi:hypothetical protein
MLVMVVVGGLEVRWAGIGLLAETNLAAVGLVVCGALEV